MKTNLIGANVLRPTLAFLLALLTISTAAPAQDDNTPDCFRRPLRVQTAAGKRPTITDFTRAFANADQEGDALFSATIARIDGRQPKLPQGERFTCLIDRPHGYLRAVYTTEGNIDPNQTLEVCYWRTDTDHRLVAVCHYSDIGTYFLRLQPCHRTHDAPRPAALRRFPRAPRGTHRPTAPRRQRHPYDKLVGRRPCPPYPPLERSGRIHHCGRRRALPTALGQPTHHLRLPRTLHAAGRHSQRTRRPLRHPRRQSCPPSRHPRSRLRLAGQARRKRLGLRRLRQ